MKTSMHTPQLIQDILDFNIGKHPDKIALICEKARLTYAQLDDMSGRMAAALRQNGVQDGDRILFYLLNSAELVVSIFASLKAGAIFSVLDYANTPETLRHIAADCEAAALVTYDHQWAAVSGFLDELPSLRLAICVGAKVVPEVRVLSFAAIQQDYPPDAKPADRIPDDLAYLIYTSGSTGKSKGVMVTHRCALFTCANTAEHLGLSSSDIHTSPLPLSFSPGMNQLFQTLWAGGTLILEQSFTYPVMTLKRMASEGATSFAGVPTILALLLSMDLSRYDLSRLRYITSIGAALPTATIQQIGKIFPDVLLFSTYGMAEASHALGLDPAQIEQRPTSVGRPFPDTQAWVVDEEGRPSHTNATGELVLRGGHVRSGYWNNPQLSAKRFRPAPLPGEQVCFTGDIFRIDEQGYFYFLGRSDEIIKSGAKKVVPTEIENALHNLPGVLDAAAVGIPDPLLGHVIKAFVVLDEPTRATLTTHDILTHCRQTLEEFKVPRQIEIRDSLPKTPSGKHIKTQLL
ncbi:MAG: acyl--CoA ligase [Chloroflexi bacterium]|nr:acyl--CoA ligase [Chloroflexota bacterium]